MRIPGLEIQAAAEGVEWRQTASEGIEWLLLNSEAEGSGKGAGAGAGATVLIRMAPGRGYPPHKHLDVEEVLVLAGGYQDHLGVYPAGSFVRYEAGSVHAPVALGDPQQPTGPNNPACILYASARGGIEPVEPIEGPGPEEKVRDRG